MARSTQQPTVPKPDNLNMQAKDHTDGSDIRDLFVVYVKYSPIVRFLNCFQFAINFLKANTVSEICGLQCVLNASDVFANTISEIGMCGLQYICEVKAIYMQIQ